MTTFKQLAALVLAGAACNGQIAPTALADAGAEDQEFARCVDVECAARESTFVTDGGSFDHANDLCGLTLNGTEDAGVIWLDQRGSCECRRDDDDSALRDCEVTLPDECTRQTTCEACNANRACAFCYGQGCLPRPAYGCEDLSTPSCN